MDRLSGPVGAVAAFALTAGLACDSGGFGAVSWDRASVGLGALAFMLVILMGGERPGRYGSAFLVALGLLAAWTAASWFWSESPPLALEEAQRIALYFTAALVCVLAGRRIPMPWLIGGVAAAATFVAVWNLTSRIAGVDHPQDSGTLATPVGYANSLALLCVLGLLVLPILPRVALLLAPPLLADLVWQQSTGAFAALGAGALIFVFLSRPRARLLVVVIALCGVVLSPVALRGHERTQYWRVAMREARADPVLGSGAGTFRDWWLRERTAPLSTQEAHSLYLETLAELGPVGFALLLAVLATPLAAALRLREPAVAAVLLAYDAGAAVDFHWELAGVTVPVFLLAASVVARASRARAEREAHVPRAPAAIGLAALTAVALLAYAGTVRLQQAEDALASGDKARAAQLAQAALHWAPFSPDAWRVVGDAEGSTAAYRRALALDPNDWSLWSRLASVTTGRPRRLALREAARLNPLATER